MRSTANLKGKISNRLQYYNLIPYIFSDEEEAANALLNECFLAFESGGYTPRLLGPEQIEPGTIVVTEEDDEKRLEFARAQVIGTGKKVEVSTHSSGILSVKNKLN